MADENKKEVKKADMKAQESPRRIEAKGPTKEENNAEVLRFYRENGRNKTMDIRKGQILTIGEDITEEEADRLLNLNFWNFKEVKK